MNIIISSAITIGAFLVALTVHECCHAAMAYLLGDDTGKRLGRLTLNPFAHIDFMGLLFLLLVRIGWAKPVPFNPDNFKYPRLYSVLVGLAGPASNFVLAILSLYGIYFFGEYPFIRYFFSISIFINIMLALFNLLPIPPLDGSHFILVQLSDRWKELVYRYQLAFFLLLILLLNIPAFQIAFMSVVMYVVGALSKLILG